MIEHRVKIEGYRHSGPFLSFTELAKRNAGLQMKEQLNFKYHKILLGLYAHSVSWTSFSRSCSDAENISQDIR